jgi:hypothetical protein
MEKTVVLVLIGNRKEAAVQVQKVLTAWGCMIKTRLGLHEGVMENCSENGLIFLELVGEEDKKDEFIRKLQLIPGVCAQLVRLNVDNEACKGEGCCCS